MLTKSNKDNVFSQISVTTPTNTMTDKNSNIKHEPGDRLPVLRCIQDLLQSLARSCHRQNETALRC